MEKIILFDLDGTLIDSTDAIVSTFHHSFRVHKYPHVEDEKIKEIFTQYPFFIAVDYTHPSAVNGNALFYAQNNIPFVMGTTGGNREELEQTVNQAAAPAVIAPNMAKQIVGLQAMMTYAAQTFPNLFKGYSLEVKESHQHGKADTSGTAKAMVGYFNELGADFTGQKIQQILLFALEL